jgi:hypothetical protein
MHGAGTGDESYIVLTSAQAEKVNDMLATIATYVVAQDVNA